MTLAPNSLAARDIAYSLHPYTNLDVHEHKGPLICEQGKGVYVYDDEGREYLEGMAGLWCVSLGFSEQRLVEAATRQLEKLPYMHLFAHRSHTPSIELAERLIQIAPEGMAKAFFVNSGSEAVDTAVKFVWYYQNALGRAEKKKIISRKRAYHGITVAGASLTHIPLMQNDFDLPVNNRFLATETPSYYRHGLEGESEEEFATRMVASLEQLILDEGAETVAAFIAEPVMGAGGVIVPPRTYYEKVQALLKQHDILFIADEVICGFGRTGNMWGSQTLGIRPDMVTCAKQLSSAYLPIAGVMISEPIYQAFVEQSKKHGALGTGYTYGGHPVSAAVALETLKIYEECNILDHVRSVVPRFQARLAQLSEHPLVGEARGLGLVGAVELVKDKDNREQYDPAQKVAAMIQEKAIAEGVIVRALPGDSVACCPPLIITAGEVDILFDRFHAALDAGQAAL